MIKIAITGNIASGKSQVQKILENVGYKVFDTDIAGHEVLDCDEIREEFKDYDVFDTSGKISRKNLGALVFQNPDLKIKLEKISHPKIRERINLFFEDNREEKFVFVGIPLLFEAKMEDMFDKIVLICADDEIRQKRLMKRNSLAVDEAILRMQSQIPQAEKVNKSDYIIYNNSGIKELSENTLKFLKILKSTKS